MASSDHFTTAVPGLSRQWSGLMHVCNHDTTVKTAAVFDRVLWKIKALEYVFTLRAECLMFFPPMILGLSKETSLTHLYLCKW